MTRTTDTAKDIAEQVCEVAGEILKTIYPDTPTTGGRLNCKGIPPDVMCAAITAAGAAFAGAANATAIDAAAHKLQMELSRNNTADTVAKTIEKQTDAIHRLREVINDACRRANAR